MIHPKKIPKNPLTGRAVKFLEDAVMKEYVDVVFNAIYVISVDCKFIY